MTISRAPSTRLGDEREEEDDTDDDEEKEEEDEEEEDQESIIPNDHLESPPEDMSMQEFEPNFSYDDIEIENQKTNKNEEQKTFLESMIFLRSWGKSKIQKTFHSQKWYY